MNLKKVPLGTFIPKPSPMAADESLKMLVGAWSNYKHTVEVETTKRSAISAWRDTRIAELDTQRDILQQYLAGMFQERSTMISGFFVALDKGIEQGNSELINQAMASIVAIAKESPLAQAKEVLLAMYDPNVKHIEI